MKLRVLAGVAAVAASSMTFGVAGPAQADHHCAAAGPLSTTPQAVIASGYFGTGGVGGFDSYGCVAGIQAADTRVIYPAADFVVLVQANAGCSAGQRQTGSLSGLGVNASVPMACVVDAAGKSAYVSDAYAIDKLATGTISGAVGSTWTQSTKYV